jgi:hypothetical protein
MNAHSKIRRDNSFDFCEEIHGIFRRIRGNFLRGKREFFENSLQPNFPGLSFEIFSGQSLANFSVRSHRFFAANTDIFHVLTQFSVWSFLSENVDFCWVAHLLIWAFPERASAHWNFEFHFGTREFSQITKSEPLTFFRTQMDFFHKTRYLPLNHRVFLIEVNFRLPTRWEFRSIHAFCASYSLRALFDRCVA